MPPSDLVATLCAKGSLDAADVFRLRQEVYSDGVIDKAEAEAGKKKVLGAVAKKLLELQGQAGKVSTTALRATRTKYLSDI